ncbi:hypothetical protein E2C01_052489 [Portunus trituberculatus]|uniref:Uncharacterized protein n=1 Tax=Portunus trituberculatus TaxID=210409 RepID=A0A5B7GPI5_PORTR|nr:hypothetical protein [Portunus trituberculatus]
MSGRKKKEEQVRSGDQVTFKRHSGSGEQQRSLISLLISGVGQRLVAVRTYNHSSPSPSNWAGGEWNNLASAVCCVPCAAGRRNTTNSRHHAPQQDVCGVP